MFHFQNPFKKMYSCSAMPHEYILADFDSFVNVKIMNSETSLYYWMTAMPYRTNVPPSALEIEISSFPLVG